MRLVKLSEEVYVNPEFVTSVICYRPYGWTGVCTEVRVSGREAPAISLAGNVVEEMVSLLAENKQ